ncbi:MAG: hypothetical protein RLY20_1843 [Verrucomicrobiota bacterium]|jgi:hypothetical protein
MRLFRNGKEAITFRLTSAERSLFQQILRQYPVVPPSHHKLSKTINDAAAAEDQHLLDEALAEQRGSHKKHLDAWLSDPKRFRTTKTSCTLTLPRTDVEWLLQVLNDVRVGNWLLLGGPQERIEPDDLDPQLHRLWASMELAGMFQMAVLHALELSPPP